MNTTSELASSAMRFFESTESVARDLIAPEKARVRVDLTPDRVRALLEASRPLSAEETRRAMVRQVKPGSCGRAGLPDYAVKLMYADYQRLGSLAKVGKLHGRTRQSIYQIFVAHGLPLNQRKFREKVSYRGRDFTPGKDGYYRATTGDRIQLHYAVWQDAHGPVPEGHQVTFKNADCRDCRLENLACMPIREVTLFHAARHKAAAKPRLSRYSLFR